MTAIWLLSTRGRPDACQEVLDACVATGMTSPGIVYVDETIDLYSRLRLPSNWVVHHAAEWGSLQASLSYVLERYPAASRYGWLADDTVPRTQGWDRKLEAAAGDYGFAHARDLWQSEDPISEHELIRGEDMSAGLCWGGELVRTVGWWALPGVRQAGIDTAWTAVLGPLGLVNYRRDVVVEHKHYRTGKRDMDAGDSWERDGHAYIEQDIRTRNQWVGSDDFVETVRRVAVAAARSPDWKRLHTMVVDARANEMWFPGMPAVRLTNLRATFDTEVGALVANIQRAHADAQPA